MDIDTLFTVIFVVVIILFQLFGAIAGRLIKKNQDQPGQSGKAKGLIINLKNRVSREIQIAMQQAAAAQKGPEERVKTGTRPLQRAETKQPASPVYKKTAKTVAAAPTVDDADLIEDIRQGLMDTDTVVKTIETQKAERKPGSYRPGYTPTDLRRAVIWSEILGPPVALRD